MFHFSSHFMILFDVVSLSKFYDSQEHKESNYVSFIALRCIVFKLSDLSDFETKAKWVLIKRSFLIWTSLL